MAAIQITHQFNGDLKKVFAGIKSYAKYPDFLPGVQKIEVNPAVAKGSVCQVRYELNIIKTFFYVLDMFEDQPKKLWWTMADSNLMKANEGRWDFKAGAKGKTEAVYTLDVQFRGFVPG